MSPLLAMAYREYRIRLTNPILPLWDIVVPVMYLIVFGSSLDRAGLSAATTLGGLSVDYTQFFFGGVVSMVTFSVAMNSAYPIFEDLQSGVFHESLTYPLARRDLLLGKLLFNAGFGLAGMLCCVIAAVLVLNVKISPWDLLPISLWTLLGAAGWYFVFIWLSLQMRGFNAFHTTTSGMYLFLMFISNLFYPIETLPAWIRWLAYANPVTWLTGILRFYTGAMPGGATLLRDAVLFVLFIGGSFWLANRKLNGAIE